MHLCNQYCIIVTNDRFLTKLAIDAANYVQAHLSERFRAETGQTLTDFILKEKTEKAKRLLSYSDKAITAISDYLGFSSPVHFFRVFRKYAACPPSEYRDRYAK